MKDRELAELKRQIFSRIETLQALLGTGAGDEESTFHRDDDSAQMDLNINAAVTSRITLAEKQELSRLMSNLQWLDSDEAGCCEECGNLIPYARLQAVPITRLCIECADK